MLHPQYEWLKTTLLNSCFWFVIRRLTFLYGICYRQCKARQATVVKDKRDKQQKVLSAPPCTLCSFAFISWLLLASLSFCFCFCILYFVFFFWKQDKRQILIMEDLSRALREVSTEVFCYFLHSSLTVIIFNFLRCVCVCEVFCNILHASHTVIIFYFPRCVCERDVGLNVWVYFLSFVNFWYFYVLFVIF